MGLVMIAEPVSAGDPNYPQALVVEPFLEIHTGPAKSYPIFYIAEKGETLFLMKRRVDWYKIRLTNGREGWAHQWEIEKTLQTSGYQQGFSEKLYKRWIAQKMEAGWGAGTFGGDQALYVRMNYHFTDALAVEGNIEFLAGDLGDTQLYHGGVVMTPWKMRWLWFSGTLGGGLVHVNPTSLLVNATTGTFPSAFAGIGFTTPIFRNLLVRGDFRNFTLFMSPKQTREFQEYSMGLSFSF
jgi:uncharacterized protein YgiM (DUF1202 family)